MRIERTRTDPFPDDERRPTTWVTTDSHWWDGSQIYGSEPALTAALRERAGGRLRLDPDGQLPRDLDAKVDLTGVAGNFWLGLALLHTLFTREHNAIADRLAAEHPEWTDDQLFAKARLITAALMAKIHTVEWTPAIIAHPTTKYGMRANWYGILGKRLGKRSSNEVLGGIPGSATDHHGVPYSLTEEFVAVYRMHPLLPDDFTFRSIETDEVLQERTFRELGVNDVRARLDEVGFVDSFYSFGIAHPGAITLHNYPRFLQELHKPDGTVVDLAAIDVLRIRERGVPRYNEFRRLFHLKPAATFEELTDNPEWAAELREVYGDVEKVDLMVGLYAEPLPKGFGFSDTGLPRLHPDGLAAAEERPLLHQRLQRGDVHPDRARLDRRDEHERRAAPPLPRAGAGAARRRQRLRALAPSDRVRELAPRRARARRQEGRPRPRRS